MIWTLSILMLLNVGCHSREEWSLIFMNQGQKLLAAKRYDEAKAEFEKAFRINHQNIQSKLFNAEVLMAEKKYLDVVENLNVAQLRQPLSKHYVDMYEEALRLNGKDPAEIPASISQLNGVSQ